MFMLDLAYTASTQTGTVASASYGTIGICHLSENPAWLECGSRLTHATLNI